MFSTPSTQQQYVESDIHYFRFILFNVTFLFNVTSTNTFSRQKTGSKQKHKKQNTEFPSLPFLHAIPFPTGKQCQYYDAYVVFLDTSLTTVTYTYITVHICLFNLYFQNIRGSCYKHGFFF